MARAASNHNLLSLEEIPAMVRLRHGSERLWEVVIAVKCLPEQPRVATPTSNNDFFLFFWLIRMLLNQGMQRTGTDVFDSTLANSKSINNSG
jgi:hypothetical protein